MRIKKSLKESTEKMYLIDKKISITIINLTNNEPTNQNFLTNFRLFCLPSSMMVSSMAEVVEPKN